jgi:hypothetical protein
MPVKVTVECSSSNLAIKMAMKVSGETSTSAPTSPASRVSRSTSPTSPSVARGRSTPPASLIVTRGRSTSRSSNNAPFESRVDVEDEDDFVMVRGSERGMRLNNQNEVTLQTVPGIGPKLAKAIVRRMPIETWGELGEIPGIGEKRVAAVKAFFVIS